MHKWRLYVGATALLWRCNPRGLMMYHLHSDKRWSYGPEYNGHANPVKPGAPVWVVRFCGDYIGFRSTRGAALMLATTERARRAGALVVVNQVAEG